LEPLTTSGTWVLDSDPFDSTSEELFSQLSVFRLALNGPPIITLEARPNVVDFAGMSAVGMRCSFRQPRHS
jgi:hypothetical protein